MGMLISLLIALIVLGIVFAIVRAIIPLLGLPAPFSTIIYLVMLLIALFVILDYVGVLGGTGGCFRLHC
jgi:hypothetical protein